MALSSDYRVSEWWERLWVCGQWIWGHQVPVLSSVGVSSVPTNQHDMVVATISWYCQDKQSNNFIETQDHSSISKPTIRYTSKSWIVLDTAEFCSCFSQHSSSHQLQFRVYRQLCSVIILHWRLKLLSNNNDVEWK